VIGVVMIEPEQRAVWSWSRGSRLLAGGAVALAARKAPGAEAESRAESRVDRPAQAPETKADWTTRTAQRLALDWLTWSAQVGGTPSRLVVIGAGAEDFSKVLTSGWRPMPVKCIEAADPVAPTLVAATQAWQKLDAQPRPRLRGLSDRAGRAVRTRY